jgi:flagellar biosynthesis/type III secretory pathway chaperone
MDLPAVTSKEEAVVEQMNQLEKVRQQLNAKAAEQLGVTEPNPTISTLCAKLEPQAAERLGAMRDKLRAAMETLRQQNALNAELLQQSLDYVNFNLQLLARPTSSTPRYGRGGRDISDTGPTRSMMDLRS